MKSIAEKLRRKIAPWYKNLGGWRTDRKIVVIESDDWGSIRMPSRKVYEECLKAGYTVDLNPYERYDSLASEQDLELLFELLTKFKDKKGNHPVITANSLVANPDFEKIKEAGFSEYHYELITSTFKRYPKHTRCFQLWREGIEQKIFFPQSHGREHLNVSLFMNALRRNDKDVHFGFSRGMPGTVPKNISGGRNEYVIALKYVSATDKEKKKKVFLEGLDLFQELFDYQSKTFIPPNYWWSPDFNRPALDKGVRFFQGNRVMVEPGIGSEGNIKHYYQLGDQNNIGQRYLIRNAVFEPSLFRLKIDTPLENCLRNISIAFKMKKPAIICSHRINYVGFVDSKNRDKNLRLLNKLMTEITKRWPDIEFMNSEQVGRLIEAEQQLGT